jgi:hypothetical protein
MDSSGAEYMNARVLIIFLCAEIALTAQAQSSYPVIDHATQEERDEGRRQILEDELQVELKEFAKAEAAMSSNFNAEREADLHRHSENIKALERELASTEQSRSARAARIVVKARRPSAATPATSNPRNEHGAAAFWNPYNRVPEELSAYSSTTRRREMP